MQRTATNPEGKMMTTKRTLKVLRLDDVQTLSVVTLDTGSTLGYERAIFVGIEGEGDDRRAKFMSRGPVDGKAYTWEAYRYNGRWAYGSSADRLSLVSVDSSLDMLSV